MEVTTKAAAVLPRKGWFLWGVLCLVWVLSPQLAFLGCGVDPIASDGAEGPRDAGGSAEAQREADAPVEIPKETSADASVTPEPSSDGGATDNPPDVAPDAGPDVTAPEEPAVSEEPVPEPLVDRPAPIDMTWAECRRQRSALSSAQRTYCSSQHTQPPKKAEFGLRWVFLYDFPKPEAWIKARLDLINARFASAGIAFRTVSVTQLSKTMLATNGEYDDRKRFRVGQLTYELKQLLGIDPTLADAAVLNEWKKQLRAVGVSAGLVSNLTASTQLSPNAFLNRIARTREREIFIYVAKKLITRTNRTPGGYASFPSYNEASIGRGAVYLKEQYRADAGAHELGHYFGLRHTQATEATWKLPFPVSTACKTYLPNGLTSVKDTLAKQLGTDYKGSLGQPFLAYDASDVQVSAFRALRCAVEPLWIRRINTFQKPNDQDSSTWKGFASVAAFLTFYFQGGTAYEKLFSSTVNGRSSFNCGWSQAQGQIQCSYDGKTFLGTSTLLADSIAFQGGKASNLMSYLNNATTFPVRLLADAQREMLLFHSRTVERLALKNYAAP